MSSSLDVDAIERDTARRADEWLDILSALIRTPSENPPGDTREIAEYLTELFDKRGVPYEVIAPKEKMPNVVAHFEGDRGDPSTGPHLGFNGHLDTYTRGEVDRWERDPFSGAVEDGKVFGRGAADMHGGFTASLAAFLLLFENRDVIEGQVTLSATSDEETGSEWGAKYLLENYPEYRGDALINGEPTSNGIIRFGGRGASWLELRTRGESGHSAYPDGVNAIETLFDIVEGIRRETNQLVSVPEDARDVILEGKDRMDAEWGEGATEHVLNAQTNLNTIEGGEVVNVVAEKATARIDIRLPLGTPGEDVIERAHSVAAAHPGDTEVEVLSHTNPTYSEIESPILQYMQESGGEIREDAPVLSCGLALTDGRFFRLQGVPVAIYGPTPHNVGSQNEYIKVEDFMEVVKAHALTGAKYMNDPGMDGDR